MNIGFIIIAVLAGLWALGVFLGAIGNLAKPFLRTPVSLDASAIQSQEEKTIQDTESKRQQMMASMQQKIENARRKY